jgi:hypothetical protein
MAQHDYDIENSSFPTFRTNLNGVLSAINSSNSGSSRPSSAVAGTIWLDTSGAATAQLLKLYDGAADITLATVNFTANTVDFTDSSVTLADDSVTLAKMASGTDGNIISYDTSGNPVAVATGNDGQVLTSAGADAVPAFETLPVTAVANFSDNRITTASAATTLNGEANLTFNGSTLALTGNQTISTTLGVTGIASFAVAANVAQSALSSSSNAVAWDSSAKPNAFHVTTENTTFSAPSNAVEGAFICIEINYNGSHSIGWNTVFEFAASTAPTFTSSDGKTDIMVFRYNGAIWQEVGRTINLSES